MDLKLINQISRVNMLSDMIKEKLIAYENDIFDKEKWKQENPDKESWQYYKRPRTNQSEINRLLLIQRQETIKLGKML